MALPELLANNFLTTLGAAITDANATTITTSAAAPAQLQATGQFRILIDSELMIVTGGATGTSWTVSRGAEGTTKATHSNGANVTHVITVESLGAWLAPDWLQNGVVASGDGAVSSISVNSGTGAITATVAAGNAWVKEPVSSALMRNSIPSGSTTLTPGSLPASSKFAVVGIDLVAATAGAAPAIALSSKGTDQTTSALALTNTPATASGRLRLWDVVIQNTSGSYSTPANQDRRPRATGAYYQFNDTTNRVVPTSYTSMSSLAAGFKRRIECTGAPLRVSFRGGFQNNAGASNKLYMKIQVDGADLTHPSDQFRGGFNSVWNDAPPIFEWTPAAGSHLIDPFWHSDSNASFGLGSVDLFMVIEELVGRYSADNGSS